MKFKKVLKHVVGVCILSIGVFSLSSHTLAKEEAEYEAPRSTYYFSSNGMLNTYNNISKANMMNDILVGKQRAIISEMQKMDTNRYADSSVTADLDTTGYINFWDEDPSILYSKATDTVVKMRQGATEFRIWIPPGVDDEGNPINQDKIGYAIDGINKLKQQVKRGVIIGSMASSYNIFKMVPTKQVQVQDILEPAKDDNGKDLGYSQIKSAGVDMVYSLDYFFNPVLCKMSSAEATEDNKNWFNYMSKVDITAGSGTDGKSTVNIDKDFFNFSQKGSAENEIMAQVGTAAVATVPKVKGIPLAQVSDAGSLFSQDSLKTLLAGSWVSIPKNAVDASMRLMVPNQFDKAMDSNTYKINKDKGYKLVPNYRLLISRSWVYGVDSDNKMKKLGDFATYGVDNKNLVLYTIKDKDAEGKEQNYAAVVPLQYKEVLINTAQNNAKMWTGRTIVLSNSYSSKLQLDLENKDLFGIQSKGNGLAGIKVRNFSFNPGTDVTTGDGHTAVSGTAESFSLSAGFSDGSDGVKGFMMYINNTYANDPDLVKWLQTDEAKAATDVDATGIYNAIAGSLNTDSTKLSYAQWLRLREIKSELDVSFTSKLLSVVRVSAIIFGVFLIFMAVIFIIFYWIDIFIAATLGFSLIQLVSLGRMYPVQNKEDIALLQGTHPSSVRYVTFWRIFFISSAAVAIGITFVYLTPIIQLITFTYFKVTEWVGVS